MSQYLGNVSAYAYAVEKGYTGTEEEFAELMASYATVGQTAVTAAQTATTKASEAATSATTATNKASEATTAATTATTKAGEASISAQTASSKASEASASASTASAKASQASQSASQALTYKTAAESAKTASQTAQGLAETAQTAAETAQGLAEDARDEAQEIVDEIGAKASQIDTNTAEITELKNDGVAPSAEQLLSKNTTADTVPYHFRQTGGNGADREYLDAVVGGTVGWNQLAEVKDRSFTLYGVTVVTNAENGTITISGTATESKYTSIPVVSLLADATPNHVVMLSASLVSGAYSDNMFWFGDSNNIFSVASPTIKKPSTIGNKQLHIQIVSGTTYNAVITLMVQDLTAMFGSTIADYIYSLEQTTTGAGVALFKSLFPKNYYPYDAGSMQSVSGLSAHVMRDVDNNIIRSYPLDSTLTLRGISKLVDGKMCFDGDTYDADGTVARKYGLVDLGTLNWRAFTTNNLFGAVCTQVNQTGYTNSSKFPMICTKYVTVKYYSGGTVMEDMDKSIAFAPGSGSQIVIKDSAYSDSATLKTALSGVYLVHELATPTTETAEPYINPQICDPNGTEEFVSTGIVPVGHETRYPENLRAKIEGLPWDFSSLIAPTEKTTTASRNYTTGSLLIMDNTLYKVTANIAHGGTIIPNTNVTATTLSEILSALAQ